MDLAETRYFKNAAISNNGLSCYDLSLTQSASATYKRISDVNTSPGTLGIRVWKRSPAGVETEITSGTPVAQMTKNMATSGIDSATWACPETDIDSGDSLVVRVYVLNNTPAWQQYDASWQSEDLQAGKISAGTWTVHYSWYFYYNLGDMTYRYEFRFGDASVDSRIANVQRFVYTFVTGPAESLRIYKSTATGTPKSVAITAKLLNLLDDSPVAGKTVNFTTSLGSVSPGSDATDANGEAQTTLTSGSSRGYAVVKVAWAGDADAGPSDGYIEVPVWDEAPVGDAAKHYQVFVHGTEYAFQSGTYRKAASMEIQDFTVTLDCVHQDIDSGLEVEIWRRGVKDFAGRITDPVLDLDDSMTISGKSNHWRLMRRVANREYADDPEDVIHDLLWRYACGIAEGSLGTYGAQIELPIAYDNLLVAIQRILNATGWKARLNPNNSLDVNATLGSTKSVIFARGTNSARLRRARSFGSINSRTILVGAGVLISDKSDAATLAGQGLIEQVFIDKNIADQTTLDLQNQAILDARKTPIERLEGTVIDLEYAADAYDVFDSVTVTDANYTGLSGTYQVVAITRDLTDCGSAQIELTNEALASKDLLATVATMVKDLSV